MTIVLGKDKEDFFEKEILFFRKINGI